MDVDKDRVARAQQLAQQLDFFTEDDLLALTGVTAATAENWRKRHSGPAYVVAGTRFLYPKAAVSDWLLSRVRERGTVRAKDEL